MNGNINLNLMYPTDLSVLYSQGIKNYIQFQAISFEDAKRRIAENRTNFQVKANISSAITLELGPELNLSDGHSWNSVSTLSGRSGASNDRAIWHNIGLAIDNLKDRIGETTILNVIQKMTSALSLGTIDPDIAVNEYQLIKGATIINPNTTLIYSNSEPRSLSLSYIMRPIDETEAKIIINIIDKFKQSSRGVSSDSGISFPNMWYIKTSSEPLNILLESGPEDVNDSSLDFGLPFACTNVGTNIATNYMYHNKYPNQISLNVQFTEIKPRYKRNESARPNNSIIFNVK
jgi:hypothetical protein